MGDKKSLAKDFQRPALYQMQDCFALDIFQKLENVGTCNSTKKSM